MGNRVVDCLLSHETNLKERAELNSKASEPTVCRDSRGRGTTITMSRGGLASHTIKRAHSKQPTDCRVTPNLVA